MPPYAVPGTPMADVQGPLLLGYLVAYLLYGIYAAQIFYYVRNYSKDPMYLQLFVWSVFAIETASLVVIGMNAWNDLAAGWGNPATFVPTWCLSALLPLNGCVGTVVELFFCWRIFQLGRLAKRRALQSIAAVVAAFALTQFAFVIYAGVEIQIAKFDPTKFPTAINMIIVWLSAAAAGDITIALTMIYFLYTSKRGFKDTDSKLNRLIVITVETGFLTAIVSIIELALYLGNTKSNNHFGACLPNAKLYGCVLMATLNARNSLGGGVSQVINVTESNGSSNTHKPLVARPRASAPLLWEDLEEDNQNSSNLVTKSVETTLIDRESYPSFPPEKAKTLQSFLEDEE